MTLKFDFRDFERAARAMGALERQLPFALANALTTAAFEVRRSLIEETWPKYVEVRNAAALRQALRVERATKGNPRVAIVGSGPSAQRLNLVAHAKGGPRQHKGRKLAIAKPGTVTRGPRGVPKGQRPAAIIAKTPARALRITDRGIMVGQGGRLHTKFALTPSAEIKPDVPFYSEFERTMRAEVRRAFPIAMRKAMKTAFRK